MRIQQIREKTEWFNKMRNMEKKENAIPKLYGIHNSSEQKLGREQEKKVSSDKR